MSLGQLLRTAVRLRPSQLWWRVVRRAQRRLGAPTIDVPALIEVRDDLPRLADVGHVPGPRGGTLVDQLERGVFDHLGQAVDTGRDTPDWRLGTRARDRLWTVTLHYQAWAMGLAAVAAGDHDACDASVRERAAKLLVHYVDDWIARCRVEDTAARELAWNAYAVATRLGWWARLYHRLGAPGRADWGAFEDRFLRSAWTQAAYLHERVEWDLLGNHVLRDAVGLAWAGRWFKGDAPKRWLRTAETIVSAQLNEQVLPDGGHYERSAMYHVHVLKDLFVLAQLVDSETLRGRIIEACGRMAEYLAWARHPDGGVCLFNDATLNGSAAPIDALAACRALFGVDVEPDARRGGRYFADTGLIAWHDDVWSVFFDVGPIAADCQPGHGHADALTIEASCRGHRLIVDPGAFAYDDDARRRYDRSTAAHNTVCLNDADSSEVWSVFRVGRRATTTVTRCDLGASGVTATATHDGYRRLPGRPMHTRTLRVGAIGGDGERVVRLVDRVDGDGLHAVTGGLLIDPAWSAEPGERGWALRHADGARVTIHVDGPEGIALSTSDAAYHPRFGEELDATRLTWRCHGHLPVEVTVTIKAD